MRLGSVPQPDANAPTRKRSRSKFVVAPLRVFLGLYLAATRYMLRSQAAIAPSTLLVLLYEAKSAAATL